MRNGCLILIGIFALLWVMGSLLPEEEVETSDNSDEVRPERALATRLDNATFYNQEGQLSSSIEFVSDNTGWFGAAILTQLGCRFTYSYTLDGDKIILKFTDSDCGRSSTDKIFYYQRSPDYIYTMINGQQYIFR